MSRIRNLPLAVTMLFVGLGLAAVFFLSRGEPGAVARSSANTEETQHYERIICAAPSITEIVLSLDLGARVVGVSDFSVFPPEAQEIPRIGGLINPNRERILALEPDLIIFQGKHEMLARFCREQGIADLSVNIDRISDILAAIRFIGAELGAKTAADRLTAEIEGELAELSRKVQERPPRKVFLGLGHTPGDLTGFMTTGSGTFLHELLESAGGINIFADAKGSYPRISKEALVQRQPDLIIEILAEGISPDNRRLLRKDWERLASLPAVRAGRIYFLSDDYLLIPGVRVAQTARRLVRIIHPNLLESRHD
jgi:iron complex transport system substrate-binding protein